MEVAGQWRREWAGTAEYGKVTEGGVTRRVARAMEVLQANGPGSHVRVMRAAYHSSAGPGIPASSYMLHSSRRVLSSGFNFLDSQSFPTITKPLELSSTPLELAADSNLETTNYKVTEPDDSEISEPSKWKGAASGSSIRLPSEESSSTDNASIIDLDVQSPHKNINRKYSYDSESSDIQYHKTNKSRASPLLDPPVTLSTLKYKSLLNGSNDWNNRRKSYSFEDTCPLNETILHENDTLAMESSTDSGICKSSERVNDHADEINTYSAFMERKDKKQNNQDETFKDWLSKNRPSMLYKGTQLKPCKEYDTVMDENMGNNITLQSSGKVSITVPITIEKEDNVSSNDDGERKVKRVEFCKTELHFAAESGKVNIIATDEKPPPSNDFRKRRSAFVPIKSTFEKPITLFGEKPDVSATINPDFLICNNSEIGEFEELENTAATKSILKNKIPKPKPYLLGENMPFGITDNLSNKDRLSSNVSVPTGVSLINRQLQSEKIYNNQTNVDFSREVNTSYTSNSFRAINKGSSRYNSSTISKNTSEYETSEPVLKREPPISSPGSSMNNKLHILQMSPIPKPKTRQLRDSDLTYFGIDDKTRNKSRPKFTENSLTTQIDEINNIFKSVKLIKQISSSACNSEAESDDMAEYQNIPFKTNLAPVPTPRPRSKYDKSKETESITVLQPIIEKSDPPLNVHHESRRSKIRKQVDLNSDKNRSRSEPAKSHRHEPLARNKQEYYSHSTRKNSPPPRLKQNREIGRKRNESPGNKPTPKTSTSEDEIPHYVNIKIKAETNNCTQDSERQVQLEQRRNTSKINVTTHRKQHKLDETNLQCAQKSNEKYIAKIPKSVTENQTHSLQKKQEESSIKKHQPRRTKKLVTPEHSLNYQTDNQNGNNHDSNKILTETECKSDSVSSTKMRQQNRSRPSHDQPSKPEKTHAEIKNDITNNINTNNETKKDTSKYRTRQSSQDKVNKESSRANHKSDVKSSNVYNTKLINNTEGNSPDKNLSPKKGSHKTPKRSEYVINYDDKKGTVSSICKIKSGHNSSKRKIVSSENNKETPKEYKTINKHLDKTPLRNAASRSTMEPKWTELRK
ncbi:homeobox protein 2-like isoform X2 [Achroia grisella]|uniref:homeobox protein 2-like isoform X2 n=1 Tax=Achroia grisella TaxID=688607 RepID=UPI0027D2CC50|nr:homeobox protein 2-like isoform X2 [Achroia grisella]